MVLFLDTNIRDCLESHRTRDFHDKWQFPNCLGTNDDKHIYIQPQAKTGSMYHNYKSRCLVLLMTVVDSNKFSYVSVGSQGRASDASVRSPSNRWNIVDRHLECAVNRASSIHTNIFLEMRHSP
ncbi:hypothetical protein N1851_021958 [Merluccius polli]|uniref:DDE Tnp4 domain-containing protein n=1 Tax=Merluccius polli TaxID=89951 RepID=A0AA47NXN5_MERPO|nr:hypothetical protein N1851_021958 [Merluccius polli]